MGCTGAVPKITRIFVKGNVGLFHYIIVFAKERTFKRKDKNI